MSSQPKLTEPQEAMLRRAATGRRGEVWIRRGQTKTANALAALGLVTTYMPDDHSRKACITAEGRAAVAALGVRSDTETGGE
jgi:hypothetical protein